MAKKGKGKKWRGFSMAKKGEGEAAAVKETGRQRG